MTTSTLHEVLDLKDCLNIEEQDLLKLLTERLGLHITYRERDSSEEDSEDSEL